MAFRPFSTPLALLGNGDHCNAFGVCRKERSEGRAGRGRAPKKGAYTVLSTGIFKFFKFLNGIMRVVA